MSEAILIRNGNVTKSYVNVQDELKVDKIEGKGLSAAYSLSLAIPKGNTPTRKPKRQKTLFSRQ